MFSGIAIQARISSLSAGVILAAAGQDLEAPVVVRQLHDIAVLGRDDRAHR